MAVLRTQAGRCFPSQVFPERIDDSQKDQIRKSFKRVRDNSAFRTRSWTLCIPIDMSVDKKIWFEEWKLKQTDSGILIGPVWGATKIQGLLMLDENRAIRESYFSKSTFNICGRSAETSSKYLRNSLDVSQNQSE